MNEAASGDAGGPSGLSVRRAQPSRSLGCRNLSRPLSGSLPGGATLLTPFNQMSWTAPSACDLGRRSKPALSLSKWQAVADDVPATTLVDAKIAEHQRHWRTAVLVNIHQQLHL